MPLGDAIALLSATWQGWPIAKRDTPGALSGGQTHAGHRPRPVHGPKVLMFDEPRSRATRLIGAVLRC